VTEQLLRLFPAFDGGAQDVLNLDILTSYHDQLYAAVCFSVINSIEKMFRCDNPLADASHARRSSARYGAMPYHMVVFVAACT
jgi:hypothetical protein